MFFDDCWCLCWRVFDVHDTSMVNIYAYRIADSLFDAESLKKPTVCGTQQTPPGLRAVIGLSAGDEQVRKLQVV